MTLSVVCIQLCPKRSDRLCSARDKNFCGLALTFVRNTLQWAQVLGSCFSMIAVGVSSAISCHLRYLTLCCCFPVSVSFSWAMLQFFMLLHFKIVYWICSSLNSSLHLTSQMAHCLLVLFAIWRTPTNTHLPVMFHDVPWQWSLYFWIGLSSKASGRSTSLLPLSKTFLKVESLNTLILSKMHIFYHEL